jgi:ribonuclease P protein component
VERRNNFPFDVKSRLRSSIEFKRVFRLGKKLHGPIFRFIYIKNQEDCARVGLAIPKKIVRTAVIRNRLKRLVRESFRHYQAAIKGYDVVVIAIQKPDRLKKQCLRKQLDFLWHQVEKSSKKQASLSLDAIK